MPARKKPTIPDELLDQLLDGRNAQEAFHDVGFFDDLKKALADRVLNAEMDHHLAGEEETENVRNGFGLKTVATGSGKMTLKVPRDRQEL